MSMIKPFNPSPGGTIIIANATSPAAAVALSDGGEQFAFYNSSATAIAFVRVTSTEAGATPTAATTTVDFPIPPGAQIRLTFGLGKKSISAIASAADGNLYVTAGIGN